MSYLDSFPSSMIRGDGDTLIVSLNMGGEELIGASTVYAAGRPLSEWIPEDSRLIGMIEQARDGEASLSEYDLLLESPKLGQRTVNVQVSPVPEAPAHVAVSLQERSIAFKMHRQLSYRGAARPVTAMAAMLAQERKSVV